MASKQRTPFRALEASDSFRRLSAHAREIMVTAHGVFVRAKNAERKGEPMHAWYSGEWAGAHCLVRSADVVAFATQLAALGKPRRDGHLVRRVRRLLPCVADVQLDATAPHPSPPALASRPLAESARAAIASSSSLTAEVVVWSREHGLRACTARRGG